MAGWDEREGKGEGEEPGLRRKGGGDEGGERREGALGWVQGPGPRTMSSFLRSIKFSLW